MDGGKKVWVPHATEGFKLGRIVDIGSDSIAIEPFDAPGTVSLYISPSLNPPQGMEMKVKIVIISPIIYRKSGLTSLSVP